MLIMYENPCIQSAADVDLEQSVKTNKGSRDQGARKSQTGLCSRDERSKARKRENRTVCSSSRGESAISKRMLCSLKKGRPSRFRETKKKRSSVKKRGRVKRLRKTRNSSGEKIPKTLRLRKTSRSKRQISNKRTTQKKTEDPFTESKKSQKGTKKRGKRKSRRSEGTPHVKKNVFFRALPE